MKFSQLTPFIASAALAITLTEVHASTLDTLDLNVTFVGDREVLMRDAHKEMHWPEPATIALDKPSFTYSVLPKRIDVQPTWEREKAQRLKVEDPLQRLYKGFAEAGMGNYTSPYFLLNYADLRSRKQAWGVEYTHRSTHGGFSYDDPEIGTDVPQDFSTNALEGWYKRFFKKEFVKVSGRYNREAISYYGRIAGTNEPDTSFFPLGDSTAYNTVHLRAELGDLESARRSWRHRIVADYGTLWNDRNTTERNFDVKAQLEGSIEENPVSLILHANIDRLDRVEEGLIVPTMKQAIVDFHPAIYKNHKALKTKLGFGMWVDAQGAQPFLFVPEAQASVSLLQDLFIPYVSIGGGVRQNRFETALRANPFLPSPADTASIWKNAYETFVAHGGMRGSITSAFTFDLRATHRRVNQALTWAPEALYGNGASFRPLYQDLSVTTLQANAHWKFGSTELSGQIQQHTYSVRDSALSEPTPWNLPGMELRVSASHSLKNKFNIHTSIHTATGRRGLNAVPVYPEGDNFILEGVEAIGYAFDMADLFDWDLRLEYRYNARMGAWLSGENLLNRNNPLFVGYNSQGTRVTFGFNYAF